MSFANAYADSRRAEAYSRLTFPGTYHLAFRDLPAILARHAPGEEPCAWINEMRVPPWVIYVLGRADRPSRGDGRRP